MPSSTGGVSGLLLRLNNEYTICYATHVNNNGFQRFSIAHELGHYFLPAHPEKIFSNGLHISRAGLMSNNSLEKEADQFAAQLLMPDFLFDPAMDQVSQDLSGIQSLSDICQVSLTATTIRFIQRTTEPAAMVMSAGGTIEYAFLSDSLKDYPKISWPMKGQPLPQTSLAYGLLKLRRNRRDPNGAVSEFQDWFDGPVQGEVLEEVINLGEYNRTLTLITASKLPTLEEVEEDETLVDSWKPKFR